LWKMTVRPQHALAKLIILLVIGVVCAVIFIKPMYQVTAPFQFDVINKRAVSAPYQGVLEEVYRWAGDGKGAVKKGDPLVKLRTYDLELQRNEAAEQAASAAQRAQAAYAENPPKTAEALAAEKERDAARAKATYFQSLIDQGTIRAQMDGEVLTGDLSDKVGTTVKQGDPLMLIGRHEDLRIVVDVPEHDIQMVREGRPGTIKTTALPDVQIPILVDQIVPTANPKEGSNTFKVYAKVTGEMSPDWRPGMQGEAGIDYQKKPLIWWGTHRFVDWLRLKLWM